MSRRAQDHPGESQWSSRQVADYLGVGVDTVQTYALNHEKGRPGVQLPGVKLGTRWRFEPADVRALVSGARKAAASADVEQIVQNELDAAWRRVRQPRAEHRTVSGAHRNEQPNGSSKQ